MCKIRADSRSMVMRYNRGQKYWLRSGTRCRSFDFSKRKTPLAYQFYLVAGSNEVDVAWTGIFAPNLKNCFT